LGVYLQGRFYAALLTSLGNVSRIWTVAAMVAQGSANAVVLQMLAALAMGDRRPSAPHHRAFRDS
jgi:hypothetical protein